MIANDIRFAVGYARRSTDLQERSLPDQKVAVERWARDHGFRILRWFVDDAISGTSARGRDQFTRLIHEAENGRERKYYRITPAGLELLQDKTEEWRFFSEKVNAVVQGCAPAGA